MKLLVTGGAGFIGSAVIHTIINAEPCLAGYPTHSTPNGIVVSLRPGKLRPWPRRVMNVDSLAIISEEAVGHMHPPCSEGYEFVRADIRDAEAISSVFESFRPDAVMHLAAETHVDHSIIRPRDFIESNITGTFNLLQTTLSHWRKAGKPEGFCFHYVSTDEVFGSLGTTGQFTEQSRFRPRNPYSASKAAGEHLVRAWHETYGLPIVISNCGNNFGPFQFPDKFIPKMITNALERKSIPIYGTGEQRRDWIFVYDHVVALLAVLGGGQVGRSFNIGAGNEFRNIDLAHKICEIIDRFHPGGRPHSDLITMVKDRSGHDFRYAISSERIRRDLGWRPQFRMDEALELTVKWYLDNQNWARTATGYTESHSSDQQ